MITVDPQVITSVLKGRRGRQEKTSNDMTTKERHRGNVLTLGMGP